MNFKRIVIVSVTALLCFCTISFVFLKEGKSISTSSNISESTTIILDAGHGGLTNTIN